MKTFLYVVIVFAIIVKVLIYLIDNLVIGRLI